MSKYMKKSKIAGSVAVMEVSPQSSVGVRTRAKTLALQKLQNKLTPSSPTSPLNPDSSPFSYLQLRSRRLEKPSVLLEPKKQQKPVQSKGYWKENTEQNNYGLESRLRTELVKSGSVGSVSIGNGKSQACVEGIGKWIETEVDIEGVVEASFGENYFEFEGRERITRESTPCSLIRDLDAIGTPGSTTRQSSSTRNDRVINGNSRRIIPTAREIDEFFAYAEHQQQRLFSEKYNFDLVSEVPFAGRYEWMPVHN